jgi:hypothetical protein
MVISSYFDMFRQAYVVQNACQGKMISGRRKNREIGGEKLQFQFSLVFEKKNAVFGLVWLIVTTLVNSHN